MFMVERVPTGIPGLDDLLEGGLPKGRSVLVSGGCGTGKTIMSMQYLIKGALEHDEPGLYVTVDERADLIREDMLRFGWDIKALEDEGKLALLDLSSTRIGVPSMEQYYVEAHEFEPEKLLIKIMQTARSIGAKRFVLDSIPALGFHMESENKIREFILKLVYYLRQTGLTSILISELSEEGKELTKFSRFGVEEYVVDGVIVLRYTTMPLLEGTHRILFIRKMRATKHYEGMVPLKIDTDGIKLVPVDMDI